MRLCNSLFCYHAGRKPGNEATYNIMQYTVTHKIPDNMHSVADKPGNKAT